jgi:hypothetical protein
MESQLWFQIAGVHAKRVSAKRNIANATMLDSNAQMIVNAATAIMVNLSYKTITKMGGWRSKCMHDCGVLLSDLFGVNSFLRTFKMIFGVILYDCILFHCVNGLITDNIFCKKSDKMLSDS